MGSRCSGNLWSFDSAGTWPEQAAVLLWQLVNYCNAFGVGRHEPETAWHVNFSSIWFDMYKIKPTVLSGAAPGRFLQSLPVSVIGSSTLTRTLLWNGPCFWGWRCILHTYRSGISQAAHHRTSSFLPSCGLVTYFVHIFLIRESFCVEDVFAIDLGWTLLWISLLSGLTLYPTSYPTSLSLLSSGSFGQSAVRIFPQYVKTGFKRVRPTSIECCVVPTSCDAVFQVNQAKVAGTQTLNNFGKLQQSWTQIFRARETAADRCTIGVEAAKLAYCFQFRWNRQASLQEEVGPLLRWIAWKDI